MERYIMALDAGTTSNRCILFNREGKICSVAQKEFTQIFPNPGWVEHDAGEIWSTQLGVAVEAMQKIGFVIIINTGIGIVTELRAKRTLDRLSILVASEFLVHRDGRDVEVPHNEIVLDDLLWIRADRKSVV